MRLRKISRFKLLQIHFCILYIDLIFIVLFFIKVLTSGLSGSLYYYWEFSRLDSWLFFITNYLIGGGNHFLFHMFFVFPIFILKQKLDATYMNQNGCVSISFTKIQSSKLILSNESCILSQGKTPACNAKPTEKRILWERKFFHESPGLQKAEDIWQSYKGYVKKDGEDLPSNLLELEQLYKT